MCNKRIAQVLVVFALVHAFSLTEIQAIGRGKTASGKKPTTTTTTTTPKRGRLIVQRAANVGSSVTVRVSIDGKKVADIPRNQHYGDYLSAGRHVLAVSARHGARPLRPTSIPLTVKHGRVYIYTVAASSDRLVLQTSSLYNPSRRVNEEVKPRKKFWPWDLKKG